MARASTRGNGRNLITPGKSLDKDDPIIIRDGDSINEATAKVKKEIPSILARKEDINTLVKI